MKTYEDIVKVVAALTSIDAEATWRIEDGEVIALLNVSDVFAWGCVDAERVEADDVAPLQAAFRDLSATGAAGATDWAECLHVARKRGMRPQGAFYETCPPEGAWALFNACGPHRESGLGNPSATPGEPGANGQGAN